MAELKLTEAQQAVVENRGGTLLVSAAAGSGKTKVLVDRLMSMILDEENPRNIDDFLIITYTKAAAAELRGKILAAMQEHLAKTPENRHLQRQLTRIYLAEISTVHAFCSNILRENAYRLDIPADFRVGEELECAALRQRAMDSAIAASYSAMEPEFQAFVDTLGSGRDDRALGEIVENIYDKAQSHRDPEKWLKDSASQLILDDAADFSQTVWGEVLMSELHRCLDDQIGELEAACRRLSEDPALVNAYLPSFSEYINQLRALRACGSWEAVHAFGLPDPGRLKPVRKCDHPEMKEAAQSLRKLCKEEITRRYRCFRISSQEAIEEISAIAPAIRGAFALTRAFGERYRQEKRRRHILDFSDLEHEALRLLYGKQGGRPGAVAREISERYCEILVDEYQDSNAVQDAIFRAVSREGSNLFLVGDVKQSIYRFRLADPGIFLEKYKTYASYKVSAPGEPRKILLSENFRSQPEILQAVNDVFFRAMSERTGELCYGEAEALKAGLPFPEEQCCPVELHCIRQDVEGDENSRGPSTTEVEAAFLAWHIADLLRSGATVPEKGRVRPLRPEDIAILLRSPRSAAAEYIEALQKMGIPCFTDSGADLLETTELQVLSSLMEVVENPHQDIPLLSVLASPLFGFSADELSEIRGKNRKSDFCGALRSAGTDKAARFCTLLDHFRQVNATEGLIALLDCILDETDALTVFGAMKGGKSRVANVQVFRTLVIGRAESGEDLVSFVRTLRDLRETGLPMQDSESHGAVLLTSIHKSKGLEYPVVYLAGLSKSFNLQDLNGSVLIHPSLGVASDVVDPVRRVRYPSAAKRALAQQLRKEAVSEELRVLYVAMTRAKSRLILSYCADYLDNRLKKLVLLRTFASEEQAAAQVSCEGDWVLLEALGRTEAGVLHAVAGCPPETAVSDHPWKIELHSASELLSQKICPVPKEKTTDDASMEWLPDPQTLEQSLLYRYPFEAAAHTPSKLTATQLKGRWLDQEISDGAFLKTARLVSMREKPFLEDRLSAAEAGTATHLAMQFLRYEACTTAEGVKEELSRLVREEFLTQAQAVSVDPEKILHFFLSPLGKRVLSASEVRREFKFSILMDAGAYRPEAEGERILLQGVTDCCLIEDGEITVLDFKTDRVRSGGEMERAQWYRGQLEGYAAALTRIFGCPIREKILYFFETGAAVCFPNENKASEP